MPPSSQPQSMPPRPLVAGTHVNGNPPQPSVSGAQGVQSMPPPPPVQGMPAPAAPLEPASHQLVTQG